MNQQAIDFGGFVQDAAGNYEMARAVSPDEIIHQARQILAERVKRENVIDSPQTARDFVTMNLSAREREVFAVLWLDNRHRVIAFEELFQGTIDGCSVYPREVVRRALEHNAAAYGGPWDRKALRIGWRFTPYFGVYAKYSRNRFQLNGQTISGPVETVGIRLG
ncbi:hypothetical protein Thpro_021326 [Acidihalobacter prosperus]|uniref:RadC-like JAB domain-containing protein n=1 Tax=Acidihalobacter prosperus TaxID=160660 RepID=A0A1A6C6U0_9GAMM|nr:hypothetical protein Thpro_021326 [Acidihalobacter prosperus]